jgi:tRNA (guanine-N7-)-methyltransferase
MGQIIRFGQLGSPQMQFQINTPRNCTIAPMEGREMRRSFFSWRREPFPVDWVTVFGSSGPLHLEVGFGDGRYLVTQAEARPTARFIGFEISGVSLYRAARRVRRLSLGNIRLLKVGAQFGVRHLFAPGELSSITVNFPDPWPKERHRTKRLLRSSFLQLAASRLGPRGKIKLATDHRGYLVGAVQDARATGLFNVVAREPPEKVLQTKYALKWKALGKAIYYREFECHSAVEGGSYLPLERATIMPHAILKGKLDDVSQFEKKVLQYADGHVIIHEVARTIGGCPVRWIFRVTVNDPELLQQLLVVAQPRSGQELIVRLEPFGDPVVTATVRGAVHAVTEWLLQALPELEVTERNY